MFHNDKNIQFLVLLLPNQIISTSYWISLLIFCSFLHFIAFLLPPAINLLFCERLSRLHDSILLSVSHLSFLQLSVRYFSFIIHTSCLYRGVSAISKMKMRIGKKYLILCLSLDIRTSYIIKAYNKLQFPFAYFVFIF